MSEVWIFGGGGHAKVVIDACRASARATVAGVLDDDPAQWGKTLLGVPVLGGLTVDSLERHRVRLAIVAIGSNVARAEVVRRFEGRVDWLAVAHPRSHVAPGVAVGRGAVILAGAIVQPDASLGDHAILNTASSVDHDCAIGDFAHVAPGARLAGGVRVGAGALLGIGCCVTPGRSVGEWATVGAGGVVIGDVPARARAIGVPARFSSPDGALCPSDAPREGSRGSMLPRATRTSAPLSTPNRGEIIGATDS